jgi:hypothetical protein
MDTQQTAQVYSADIRLLERKKTFLLSELERLARLHATTKREVAEMEGQKQSFIRQIKVLMQDIARGKKLTVGMQQEAAGFAAQAAHDVGEKTKGTVQDVEKREQAVIDKDLALATREKTIVEREGQLNGRDAKLQKKEGEILAIGKAQAQRERTITANEARAAAQLLVKKKELDEVFARIPAARKALKGIEERQAKAEAKRVETQAELDRITPVMQRSAQIILAREEAVKRKEEELRVKELRLIDKEETLVRAAKRLAAK